MGRRSGKISTSRQVTSAPAGLSKAEQRKRLLELDSDSLAAAFLELSTQNPDEADVIDRLTTKPTEKFDRIVRKLDAFKDTEEFYDWRRLTTLSRKLDSLLSEIKSSISDPRQGIELVTKFFESDRYIMENCDDDGMVGAVFEDEASDLFWYYAEQIEDKDWVFDVAMKLVKDDGYGCRFGLMSNTLQLTPDSIRHFISRLLKMTNGKMAERENRGHIIMIQSMAKQIKDAELYERCAWLLDKEISQNNMMGVAEVYLQCGDADSALEWLSRIPKQNARNVWGFEKLLLEIHKQTNNREETSNIAWRQFHEDRNVNSFETLLSMVGHDQKEQIIKDEVKLIHQSAPFSISDLKFLVQVGRLEDASKYLVKRAKYLDVNYFASLIPVAEVLQSNKLYVPASVIYRALIDSILNRSQESAYHLAADYFRKLGSMATKVDIWGNQYSHSDYTGQLRLAHGGKIGFWSHLK